MRQEHLHSQSRPREDWKLASSDSRPHLPPRPHLKEGLGGRVHIWGGAVSAAMEGPDGPRSPVEVSPDPPCAPSPSLDRRRAAPTASARARTAPRLLVLAETCLVY